MKTSHMWKRALRAYAQTFKEEATIWSYASSSAAAERMHWAYQSMFGMLQTKYPELDYIEIPSEKELILHFSKFGNGKKVKMDLA